jgi:GR25 family glycosyltransferase involved in LPS biosynthesis
MQAFLINLDDRPDRLASAIAQLKSHGIPYQRVSAISARDGSTSDNPFVTSGVAAIWLSHVKALREFVDSGQPYGIILEDDFDVKCNLKQMSRALAYCDGQDFLQIGYLITNIVDYIEYKLSNLVDFFAKILNRFSKILIFSDNFLSNRFLVYDQDGVPFQVVTHNVRPGAHAYIVSRTFAQTLISFNNPILFSADQFYMSLAQMRSFRMGRLRKALVLQTNSQSSVSQRFKVQK